MRLKFELNYTNIIKKNTTWKYSAGTKIELKDHRLKIQNIVAEQIKCLVKPHK